MARISYIVSSLIAWRGFHFLIAILAIFVLPLADSYIPKDDFRINIPYLHWIWGNFDGAHYMGIARDGYVDFQHGFFPLYPLAIRIVSYVTGLATLYSGLIVSHVALVVAFFLIIRLLTIDKQDELIPSIILILFLFPASLFFGAVYNDAFFFMLACLAIFFGRKRQWIAAGVAGVLAALTRMNGLAIIVYLVAEYIWGSEQLERQWKMRNIVARLKKISIAGFLKERAWGMFLVPIGLITFLLWTQQAYGNWRLVFTDMSIWNRDKFVFPLQVFWRYIKIFVTATPMTIEYWRAVWEFGFVLLYIFLILFSLKKIRLSYWLFFVVSILIPMTTGTFQGMPRYGLHVYPMFLSLALLVAKIGSKGRVAYIVANLMLQIFFIILFTRGLFVA